MAEASSSSDILCRYHLQGDCRDGDNCLYSHAATTGRPDNVCRFFPSGRCSFGGACKFEHIKPRRLSSPTKSPAHPPPFYAPIRQPLSCQSSNTATNSQMVTLKKAESQGDASSAVNSNVSSIKKKPEEWVNAVEFIPGKPWAGAASYSGAAQSGLENSAPAATVVYTGNSHPAMRPPPPAFDSDNICPYEAMGTCRFGEQCTYLHGDTCEWCFKAVLHPTNLEKREQHEEECHERIKEDMEISFAIQRSTDKTCGICMENIMEKNNNEQRFGILSNCNHVFCLACIRTWRAAKQFEHKIVRACPECRIKSDFVTPSKYWVDDKEEKTKLIEGYKLALSKKPCKHFDEGRGDCPFNENCFYRHAYPDGRPASPKPKGRKRQNADGDFDLLTLNVLWEFFEERALRTGAVARYFEDSWEDVLMDLNLAEYSSDDDDDDDDDSDQSDVGVVLV